MAVKHEEIIHKAYSDFNARDIDQVLSSMHPDVQWSNGWEGGYVYGHEAVREYWTRQWRELDPTVAPTGFNELPDGTLQVEVHQTVRDLNGNLLFDGSVRHIYTFENGLIRRMDIEKEE